MATEDTQIRAYVAVIDGTMDLRTLYGTERGVMVNGLATLFGLPVLAGCPDDLIDSSWQTAVEMAKEQRGWDIVIRKARVELCDVH